MPSPTTSRRNLANYWNRVGRPRSRDESALNWTLTFQWWMRGERRAPRTQWEWARVLGVSQPYVSKMVRRFARDLCKGVSVGAWYTRTGSGTLEELRRAQQVRERARARLAEDLEWERYDAEQRRKEHAAEYRERYGYEPDESRLDEYIAEQRRTNQDYGYGDEMEPQPDSDGDGLKPHPDPQLRA